MKLPAGKTLFHPSGRDPLDDTIILADAVAGSNADLLNDGGTPVWIHAGQRIPIAMEVLREIIAKFIVTARPVERDGKWTVLFEPVVPENRALQLMLTADNKSNGNLLQRLLKVGKPTGLSARDEHAVRVRLARGEHARDLAREYHSDPAALAQLAR